MASLRLTAKYNDVANSDHANGLVAEHHMRNAFGGPSGELRDLEGYGAHPYARRQTCAAKPVGNKSGMGMTKVLSFGASRVS